MVVAGVALALTLTVSAGLLIRSFVTRTSVDPSYRTSGIVATHIALSPKYETPASKREFFRDLLERVKRLPGVDRASAVSALPMSPLGVQFDMPFTVDGLAATSPSERPRARYRAVMAGYFETMGIRLKKGRVFVPPLDVVTCAAGGLGIIAIGVLAATVPALCASRIDPVGALRQE